jgi:FMN phosphatase YigB (HAD superfamily)
MHNKIKTIIFDYENTLGGTWHRILDYEELNINIKKFDEFDKSYIRKNFFLGKMSENKFIDSFIYKMGLEIDKEKFKKIVRGAISISPQVVELAKGFKGKYTLALASDNAREWGSYLIKKYRLRGIFSHFFWSYEIGLRKVSPYFFKRMIKELGILPSNAIFIDDKERNMRIASRIGINTILFDNRINNAYWLKQKINGILKNEF